MTPKRPEAEVTRDELARARDDDATVELVETGRAVERGPRGLSFGIRLDLRPMKRLLDAVKAVRAGAAPAPLPPAEVDDDDPPVT